MKREGVPRRPGAGTKRAPISAASHVDHHDGTSTCLLSLPSTLLLVAGRGSHPPPKAIPRSISSSTSSSHSLGMVSVGRALGEPGQSHNLESFLPLPHRIFFFFFGVGRLCVPCLACPASLCHAMPVGVRDESFRRHRRCATRLWPIRRKHQYRDGRPSQRCQFLVPATIPLHNARLSLSGGRPDSASNMNGAWSGSHPWVSRIWAHQHHAPSISLPPCAVNA